MKITCKFFALLRDRAGVTECTLDLPSDATVSIAVTMLAKRFPNVASHLGSVALAVNREYVSADTALREGDELAIIPPVSGG